MTRELVILDEDKDYMRRRIAELEKEIQNLGPEFYEVFNQSSETWHDNAPFDALRDRQSLLDAELQTLKRTLRDSLPKVPKSYRTQVWYGRTAELATGKRYFIGGDYTPHAGQHKNEAIVISAGAPLAKALIGRKVGDSIAVGAIKSTITAIL